MIVIAHRLSTVTRADNILVMHKGRLAAQGTHDRLLGTSPVYTRLWNAHQAAMEWEIRPEGGEKGGVQGGAKGGAQGVSRV